MVTAEIALALPVLILVVLTGLAALGVAQARLRCADAAAEAARALARGEPASAIGSGQGPVRLSAAVAGRYTTVTARAVLRPVPWLAALTVSETAAVATEPSLASGPSGAQP